MSLFVTGFIAVLLSPETPDEGRSAQRLHEVLADEAAFDPELTDRAAALESLRTKAASDAVWWHSGYLKIDGQWKHYDEATSEAAASKLHEEYKHRRTHTKTARQHIKLAKWCKAQRMPHRFRIHMGEAVRLDPSAVQITTPAELGLVEYAETWLTPELAQKAAAEGEFQNQSFRKWGTTCREICKRLAGSPLEVRQARQMVATIRSPDAIPAVDFIIGRSQAGGEKLAVQTFAEIDCIRSTAALAKYAVFSDAESVRIAATRALRNRRKADFVPQLLDLLSTVSFTGSEIDRPLFRLETILVPEFVFHRAYTKESRSKRETRRFSTVVTPRYAFRPNFEALPERLIPQVNLARIARVRRQSTRKVRESFWHSDRKYRRVKDQIETLNARVIPVLQGATSIAQEGPREWWNWWNDHLGTDPAQKSEIEVEVTEQQAGPTIVLTVSCFTEGTLVRTTSGPQAIESIVIGDRVLSQDIKTGELKFCVVEQTTARKKPGPTLSLQISDENITCTPGHEIWQNGVGWVRAKELKPGDMVRTLTGSAKVRAIEEGPQQVTYNLVVEGNHTYFAGESGFLVQDVTTAIPTDNVVPGLSRFDLAD